MTRMRQDASWVAKKLYSRAFRHRYQPHISPVPRTRPIKARLGHVGNGNDGEQACRGENLGKTKFKTEYGLYDILTEGFATAT